MFAFKRWSRCVAGAVCCGLVGAVWVPGVAAARGASGANVSAGTGQEWAVVSANGTIARGNGATSATRTSKGRYQVQFAGSLSKCAYEATAGTTGTQGIEVPIEVTVGQPEGKTNDLFVQTFEQATGKLVNESFHVTTYCGANADFAVVNSDGTTARASHVVSSMRTDDGAYDVTFDHDVHACAFTATIGTAVPGEVLIPGEITVGTVVGNNDDVFVQTMSRQGADADFPFHLAVTCAATSLFGVINADGTTAIGSTVVSSGKFSVGPGLYRVIFNRNVSACAYTATVNALPTIGSVEDPLTITTASLSKNKPNGVFLLIENIKTGPEDAPFDLTVTC